MSGTPSKPDIDRRDFINGNWTAGDAPEAGAITEIASILVQARPEQLERVAASIEQLPGSQIYSRDPRGKLVVVLEASEVGAIGSCLNTISLMPDVLSAALVFHGTDVS